MNYIVLSKDTGGSEIEYPVIFPESLDHTAVAAALVALPALTGATMISAGKCHSDTLRPNCYGAAADLSVKSRSGEDTSLIISYDHTLGQFPDQV